MADMSDPTSGALFGADGTQAPEPVERDSWQDAPQLPPMYLSPVPDDKAMREAIEAALRDESEGGTDQEPAPAPAPQPAGPPPPAQPPPLEIGSSGAGSSGAGSSATGQPARRVDSHSSRPQAAKPPTPGPPPLPPAKRRYRPPMAVAFRRPLPPAVLRRRVGRDHPGMSQQSTANLTLTVGLSTAFVLVIVLLYNIITGFLEALSRLFS